MSEAIRTRTLQSIIARVQRLGARTLTAMATALIASVLLFLSPEIGLAGAISGVVVGGISAVLMRPHVHM
jgi:hypothetical protein